MLTLVLSAKCTLLIVDMVVVGRDIALLLVYVKVVVVSRMQDVCGLYGHSWKRYTVAIGVRLRYCFKLNAKCWWLKWFLLVGMCRRYWCTLTLLLSAECETLVDMVIVVLKVPWLLVYVDVVVVS